MGRGGEKTDVLAQLRAAGVDAGLIAEVERGYLREANYTQKTQKLAEQTQQLAQMREQMAYLLGQQRSGGAAVSKSKLDAALESLGDDEQARGAVEFLKPLFLALQEDLQSATDQRVQPLLSQVEQSERAQALDRRLESELVPQFGAGIKEHWPELREQMLSALGKNQWVDPIGFTYRALGTEAHDLAHRHLEEQHKQQSNGTGEGFARVVQKAPSFGGGNDDPKSPAGMGTGGGGAGKPAPPPTLQDQASEYLSIMAEVSGGR